MSETKVAEKVKTIFHVKHHFPENLPFMRQGGKIGARQDTDENILWRMRRFVCCIATTTDTLKMCETYCFSAAIRGTRTRLSVTLYVECLSCLFTNLSVAA